MDAYSVIKIEFFAKTRRSKPKMQFRAGFWGSLVDFWKIEPLSFWQRFIIEDRRLKFDYSVYGDPIIKFSKKKLKKTVSGSI